MFRTRVVAIDTLEASSWAKALPAAIRLAEKEGASLILATVVPDFRAMIEAEWSAIGYREMLDSARTRLRALIDEYPGAADAETIVGSGSVRHGILDIAERKKADLIVMASHRPTAADRLIGAHALSVASHARCSVLLVRP